jgi:DNA repair exonuclease SbcCD ATPase subunit/DNA repair exonuclease SbcCD nuclease subunit
MRIFHFSDTHNDPANEFNTKPALIYCAKKIVEEKPDLAVVAGDLFDTKSKLDPSPLFLWREIAAKIQQVCPMFVMPGNHDVANEYRSVDSVTAALHSFGHENYLEGAYPIYVGNVPDIYEIKTRTGERLNIAAMPAPSKFHYKAALANQPSETSIDEAICAVLRGFQIDDRCRRTPTILVYHGSVKGGTFDNGRVVGEGMGVEIPRDLFEGPWLAVLAGDLHSFQTVGRVVYSGAIAPLNYNLQGYHPVMLDWKIEAAALFEPIEIPVAHQLLTVDVGAEELKDATPTDVIGNKLAALSGAGDLDGAIVRVRLKLPEHRVSEWDEAMIRSQFGEVHEWKFQMERIPALRIRGESVAVDTAIETLMQEWVGLNTELAGISEDLIKFAGDVDSTLPSEAFTGASGAHYRPIRASATNWMQYESAEIPFDRLRQLNCLNGPNMAGKSNAALIEPMALYGKKALGDGMTLRDVVRIGARQTDITLEFETGSTEASRERWRIERTVKLSGNNTASGGLNLMMKDGPDWVSANGPDATATQRRIDELVGSPEVFFRTRFARQGDVAAVLDMKPSELKDTILDALNAQIFDRRKAVAKDIASGVYRQINECDGRLQGLRSTVADEQELRSDIEGLIAEQKNEKETIDRIRSELDTIAQRSELLTDQIRNLQREKEKWQEAEGRRLGLIEKKAQLQTRAESAQSILENESTIRLKTEEVTKLKDRVDQFQKKLVAMTQLASDLTKVESKIGENVREHERAVKDFESEIERLERKAKLSKEVPCEGREWFEVGLDPEAFDDDDKTHYRDMSGCQFLVDAVAAGQALPIQKSALAELESQKADLNKLEFKQRYTLQKEIETLDYDQKLHQAAQKELGRLQAEGWEKLARKAAEARGSLDQMEHQIKDIAEEVAKAVRERDGHQVDEAQYSALTVELSALNGAHKDGSESLDWHLNRNGEIGRQLAKLEGLIETNQKTKTEIEKTETRLAVLRAQASIGEAYIKAVSRDGIPFLLLERAIPSLQTSVNDILTETPVSIEIEALRELASGKIAEGVSIRYRDSNGIHPLPSASGFQCMILGMALRAGIAELEQVATGFRVELVYIDEGFGAFDDANLETAHDVLRRIGRRFVKVVYITHVSELKAIADVDMRVVPSAVGSRLEVA